MPCISEYRYPSFGDGSAFFLSVLMFQPDDVPIGYCTILAQSPSAVYITYDSEQPRVQLLKEVHID